MRKWSRHVAGVVAVTGLLALVACASAETCKLETKRVTTSVARTSTGQLPVEYWFRSVRSQSFFMQIGGPKGMIRGPEQSGVPNFSKVITKEPKKYNSENPFRGVAKLGSQNFGFVFDTAKQEKPAADDAKADKKAKSDTKAKNPILGAIAQLGGAKAPAKVAAYERLYFDLNHNGDLTDDEVIEATTARNLSASYVSSTFPEVDVTIDLDGTKVNYAFRMGVYSNASASYSYANASLSAAAYREGEMELDGKKYRIVIVDFNSNGRYDDPSKIDSNVRLADGSVYPTIGDMLYVIDPEATATPGLTSPYDPTTNAGLHYISKLVNHDGRFFDLTVSPSGDEVTLEPSSTPTGFVKNSNIGYTGIVYGEQGFLKIMSDESGKAPLPVGKWKLASYTINKTAAVEEPDEGETERISWVDGIKHAITRTPARATAPRYSMVNARAKRDYQAVEVKEGQTVEMPFGGPYRPIVTIGYSRGKGVVSLSMSLTGAADEVCTNLVVDGKRPGKPAFTITTEDGEEVDTGSFEYG